MEIMNMGNPFIQYCEEMVISTESNTQNKDMSENEVEREAKKILSGIMREYARVFNREALKRPHAHMRMRDAVQYNVYEEDNVVVASAWVTENRPRSGASVFAFSEWSDVHEIATAHVEEKFEKEFKKYGIELDLDDGYVNLSIKINKLFANESFIDVVTESSKEIKATWERTMKEMDVMREEINKEEDIKEIVNKLSAYLKLVEKMKSEIEVMDYGLVEKLKMKLHGGLSKALPLVSFFGTFTGLTIINKKADEAGIGKDIHFGGFTRLVASAIASGYTKYKIGSPKDIKKGYLCELEYLITEIKLQEKLMKKLLEHGIKTISETDDYDIEVTSSGIKITKEGE